MIRLSSRYATGEVVYVKDPKTGTTIPTVFRTVVPSGRYTTVYTWREGDRADILGKSVENKASLWWNVFDRNTESIDPLSIEPGTRVVIR